MTKMLHILHQKQSATVVDMQLTVTIIYLSSAFKWLIIQKNQKL